MAGQPSRSGAARHISPRILRGCTVSAAFALVAACSPCAVVRDDLERALREEAALVGVGARPDAGWRPHGSLTVGHDLLQRLVGVLDSGAALPELRVEGGSGADAWVLRSTPRLASLAIHAGPDGGPLLHMRFVGGDDSSLRVRRADAPGAAVTEAIAVVPIVLDPLSGIRVDADFGRAEVVDPVVLAEATTTGAYSGDAVVAAWRTELERILRFDVGTVELFRVAAPIGLGVRLMGVRPGTRDSLVLTFVSTLRPARAGDLPDEVDVPGSSLRLHPGLVEAWLRERTADSLARRTMDPDGALDASADTVLSLESAEVQGDRITVVATLRCTGVPRCEVLEAPASGRFVFGRDGARVELTGTQRAAGWRALASEEMSALLNGFAIALPDQAPIRLLPRTLDANGGLLLRAVVSE